MSQDFYRQWLDTQKSWLENVSKLGNESIANHWTAPYKNWLETQEQAYQTYQSAIGNDQVAPSLFNPFVANFNQAVMNPLQAYQTFDKAQKNMYQQLQSAYEKTPVGQYISHLPNITDYSKQLMNLYQFNPSELTNVFGKESKELFYKLTNATKVYDNFYKLYQEYTDTILQPASNEIQKTWSQLLEQGKVNYQTLVEPFIPIQVKSLIDSPIQMLEGVNDQLGSFWKPWKDASEDLVYLYNQSLLGDTTKLSEFYDLWRETYGETFGAMMQSPLMGNNAEFFETQNEYMDQLIRLLIVSSEFSAKLHSISQKFVKEHSEEFMGLVEKNEHPKTYQEFYRYWSKKIEETIMAYMYTDEFSELLGEFSSAYAKTRKQQNAVMERYLANTPIVLESDMRSLYKKVHELKREVRSLKKELKALNQANEEKTSAPVKRTPRTTAAKTTEKTN